MIFEQRPISFRTRLWQNELRQFISLILSTYYSNMKMNEIILCILSISLPVQCAHLTDSEKLLKYPTFVHLDIVTHAAHVLCGGTYIQEYWVMTAAHCLDNTMLGPPAVGNQSRITLYMGTVNTRQGGTYRKSTNLIMHPGYVNNFVRRIPFVKTKQKEFDVGLVKIDSPFSITDVVRIANLVHIKSKIPRLIALGYSLEPSELIECQSEANRSIINCAEELEAKYNGGPLYIYDSNEVVGIFINAYNEEYGVILTNCHSWMKTIMRMHMSDKDIRGIGIEDPKVVTNCASDSTFRLLRFIFINVSIVFITFR